jgi:hypothetical protein
VLLLDVVVAVVPSGGVSGGETVVGGAVSVARLPVSVSPKPRLYRLQNVMFCKFHRYKCLELRLFLICFIVFSAVDSRTDQSGPDNKVNHMS